MQKWLALGLALLVAVAGCTGKQDASGGSEGTKSEGKGDGKAMRIAVIPKGSTHEFWKSVHAGAKKAGDELGVEVIWKGPMKEDDRESQIKVVEDFVTTGVSGIVLAPLDDTALRAPVDAAQKAGIPVLIIDSGLKDVQTVSFVATDNFKGGEMAGGELARLMGGKGKILLLRYQEGSASTTQREEGFLSAIAEHAEIQVLDKDQHAGATTESAQTASENLLSRFKNPDGTLGVDGIFCPNESSTFGMLRVLQDNGWAGKVKFVGFDASSKLVDALKAGEVNALVVQNPFNMGYLGVKNMVAKLKGETVPPNIDTGAVLVTKENMETPDVAQLISPPKE